MQFDEDFNLSPKEVKKLIQYEDNHLLVVEKPVGMLSQSERGDRKDDLLSVCRKYLKVSQNKEGEAYIGLVHRLDRPVGGLIVFAKTSKAASRLSSQIRERKVKKVYTAILSDTITDLAGELKGFLLKDKKTRKAQVKNRSFSEAKPVSLEYKVVRMFGPNSIVRVLLHTGRFHQIRAQFAHKGFPLMGDKKYGSQKKFPPGGIALYATELSFSHPTTKEEMTFKVTPPWPQIPIKNL
ncbi:MAG: RluA family pseudouridine synthase [Lentisphaeria bacterium]|nr:RluA family pseudouridine synthase [Lentisphaeria bacterium]